MMSHKTYSDSKGHLFVLLFFLILGLNAQEYSIKTKEEAQKAISYTLKNIGSGTFFNFLAAKQREEHFFNLGEIPRFKKYSAVYRNRSSWMVPSIGSTIAEIPMETQFLLIDRGSSGYLILIPLVDYKTRCSLEGQGNGELRLIAETGDTTTLVDKYLGLYAIAGKNPKLMVTQAIKDIQNKLKTFSLRSEKKVPWYVDYYGWCTWNALYTNLSKDTLAYAMENFRKKNIPLRYIILDNGWQGSTPNGDGMSSYEADKDKFPKGIGEAVAMLKDTYGLEKVLVWQALWGKFKGLDPDTFKKDSKQVSFLPPKRMGYLLEHGKDKNLVVEATVGPKFYPGFIGSNIFIPKNFYSFYNEYYTFLRDQGVDGVKVDAITWIEATGNNTGGRVKAMRDMAQGLQSAVDLQLNNEIIYCSSCSNDFLFNTLTANVTRSSGDFFPDKPESNGFHVFTNAQTAFWMSEIVLPDWDMFQSGSKSGAFHAAARSISGGPIYTTEEIGSEDKTILDKLMTSSGKIPRCRDAGMVCNESLFTDPEDNEKAVKIYNTNLLGGIVGVFNCSYDENQDIEVTETIKGADIEGLQKQKYAVYQYSNDSLLVKDTKGKIPVKLKELGFDLFTYVPIRKGFAPIGIIGKYNPAGMISEFNQPVDNLVSFKLLEGGKFVAYSEKKPIGIFANSKQLKFSYNSNRLELDVPEIEDVIVTLTF